MDFLKEQLDRVGPTALRTYLECDRDWKAKDASLAEHFYRLLLEQVCCPRPAAKNTLHTHCKTDFRLFLFLADFCCHWSA